MSRRYDNIQEATRSAVHGTMPTTRQETPVFRDISDREREQKVALARERIRARVMSVESNRVLSQPQERTHALLESIHAPPTYDYPSKFVSTRWDADSKPRASVRLDSKTTTVPGQPSHEHSRNALTRTPNIFPTTTRRSRPSEEPNFNTATTRYPTANINAPISKSNHQPRVRMSASHQEMLELRFPPAFDLHDSFSGKDENITTSHRLSTYTAARTKTLDNIHRPPIISSPSASPRLQKPTGASSYHDLISNSTESLATPCDRAAGTSELAQLAAELEQALETAIAPASPPGFKHKTPEPLVENTPQIQHDSRYKTDNATASSRPSIIETTLTGLLDKPGKAFKEAPDSSSPTLPKHDHPSPPKTSLAWSSRSLSTDAKSLDTKVSADAQAPDACAGSEDIYDDRTTTHHEGHEDAPIASPKQSIADYLREPDSIDEEYDIVGKAELDDGFDVVRVDGPSAVNGGFTADDALDAMEEVFQPTLEEDKDWNDDQDEWEMATFSVSPKTARDRSTKVEKAVRFSFGA